MKKAILSALLVLSFGFLKSQEVFDITGVKRISANDLRAIIENNEVKGYYAFYALDKASGSEYLYNLAILDKKDTFDGKLI